MTRFLIFIASVCVGCTLISSTASASPAEWTHAGRAAADTDEDPPVGAAGPSLISMSVRSEAYYGSALVMP
jgi:hypothetical protein